MSATRDPDQILHAWLEEGPTVLPAPTVRAIEVAARATAQRRRATGLPWRPYTMPTTLKYLAVAAALLVVLIGGAFAVGMGGSIAPFPPQPTPAPTPSPTATTSPSAAASPAAPEAFSSPLYGYSVSHPASWRATPATDRWSPGSTVMPDVAYTDTFHPEGTTVGAAVAIAAQSIPSGVSASDWMADWAAFREETGGPCFGPASAWTDASVASAPARRIEAPCDFAQAGQADFAEYAWVVDGTGYVISGTPSVVDLMVASFEAP
jgi:hypothetical protein